MKGNELLFLIVGAIVGGLVGYMMKQCPVCPPPTKCDGIGGGGGIGIDDILQFIELI